MANMNLLTKLKIGTNAALIHGDNTDFPATPQNGEMVMKNGILYVYSTIDGVTTWYPLTNKKSIYVHQQAIASTTWTVSHNFNTDEFIYMVYDSSHNLMQVNNTLIDLNSFTIDFSEATTGMVVVIVNSELIVPTLDAQDVNANSIDVASGTVILNNGGITVNGTNINDAFLNLAGGTLTGDLNTLALIDGRDVASDGTKLDGIEANATADMTAAEILTAVKTVDGTTSGLDADLLDGQEGSHYLDWTNTTSKPTTISGYGITDAYTKAEVDATHNTILSGIDWKEAVATFADLATTYTSPVEGWTASVNDEDAVYRYDGSAWVLLANGTVPLATGSLDGKMSASDFTKLAGIESGATADMTAAEILTAIKTVDGTTSGLDADLLDGLDSRAFARETWSIVTASTGVTDGQAIAVDTTSSAITLTLPSSPVLGDTIIVLDAAGNAATNNITIARNSSNIMSLAEDMVVSTDNASFKLVFINTSLGWRIV